MLKKKKKNPIKVSYHNCIFLFSN